MLANGAGLDARPLSPAILAFAALLTMTMFEVAGSLAAAGPAAGQALAAWRRLNEMIGLGARQVPADPAVPQPQAPDSGAWVRGDVTLRGLIAGMGDEPALWIDQLDLPGGGFTVLTGASGAGKSTLLRVQPARDPHSEVHRHGRAPGEGLHGGPQASLGQDRRVDPAGDLPHVPQRVHQAIRHPREFPLQLRVRGRDRPLAGAVACDLPRRGC